MQDNAIHKYLTRIMIIIVLFVILLYVALMQVSKGARFHQLNSLHLKYVVELKSRLANHSSTLDFNIDDIRETVLNIRQQPADCLALITSFDRTVMALIKTDNAIALCHADLATADQVLTIIDEYQNGAFSAQQLYDELYKASAVFTQNSAQFEEPITATVEFIVTSSIVSFGAVSLFMVFFVTYASKAISSTAKTMVETTEALEHSEQKNKKLAHYDSLTGLPNRNLFNKELKQSLQLATDKNAKLALLFIDLDRFKNVNDSLGHQAGDELIRNVGQRLNDSIRSSDTLARIGGDEFNILLPGIKSAHQAAIVANKIIKQLEQPCVIAGHTVYATVSIGIATYPEDAQSADDLQKYADLAMYHAKENGRNKYDFYAKELTASVDKKLKLEQHLYQAINEKQFVLHYQPIVDLKTMKTQGAEALVRWQHPDIGVVSPADFIPLAEETGLIVELGDWILHQACQTAKNWIESCPDFFISVNVSPLQLRSKHFLDTVRMALHDNGIPASALHIEITENLKVHQDPATLALFSYLHKMGVHLSLDDFGTGHSSLSYLHSLPFDVLKIDRSFLTMHSNENKTNIVSSIVTMAHGLKLKVIAEGLESAACLEFVTGVNCDYAQGYYLGRPVPAEELEYNKVHAFPSLQQTKSA
ncbi:EAL domain-containing protein [Endozoicomonas sp. G2_1]|uniref:putative bifunctional diguanylate cyclase/phosphodiesterase n=1 Tax=Endozoicomonas sp. G2_1 TaxID=2821091 RepID=UPI001ADB93C1|nr:EAL domain-containing protein [Endozoicomonas sp. G2_1]MBO9489548.1 EAL domain-containing protein [Endozoicomonas sp. G2_1]